MFKLFFVNYRLQSTQYFEFLQQIIWKDRYHRCPVWNEHLHSDFFGHLLPCWSFCLMQKPPTVKSFCLIWTFLSFPESSNPYLWLKVLSCDFTTRARPPLLMNLDDVVKRGVFWCRTQSLSYFVDRVPLSLAPNDCRKRPRDLKARSRRQSLQKQIKLWNVESNWKLCSIKKKKKK